MKTPILPISVVSLACAGLVSGCGGSPAIGTASNPQARVVDALASPPSVSASVDGSLIVGASTFGSVSSYQVYSNGNRNIIFTDAVAGTTLVNQTTLFQLNSFYTLIAYQSAGGPALLVLSDSNHASSVQGAIRFAKVAAGTTPIVDVYVTLPGASIASVSPTYSAVTLGSANQPYVALASGTYEVRETANGSKAPLIDQQVTLNGGTATTLLDDGTTTYLNLQDQ